MPDPMTDSELASVIQREIDHALGWDGDELAGQEERALDYYLGRYPRKPVDSPNRSGVISKDVEDAIDATIAQIMPAFSIKDLGQFEPESQDDESQAAQESEYINYLLMDEQDGRQIIKTALTDALLQRNCTVKAYIDKKIEVKYESYTGVPENQLLQILSPRTQGETVETVGQEERRQVIPGPMGPVEISIFDLQIRRYVPSKKIQIDPVAPEDRKIAADLRTLNLNDARFVCHRVRMTISDLVAMGIDELTASRLQDGNTGSDTREYARSRDSKEWDQYRLAEKQSRQKVLYDIFYNVDFDGDGIAERRHILYSSGKVLINEPYPVVLMAGGTCYPMAHRWMGRSLFDKLKDVQEVKTELVRQTLEAGRININQRLGAIREKVDPDSILESRTGGVVWADDPTAIWALPMTQLPPESWQLLEYQDKMRRERGGGAIDQAGQAQAVGGDTAHGLERTVSLMEQLNAEAAKEFASSFIKQLYLLLHHLVKEYADGPVSYRSSGQWRTVNPAQWPERTKVVVNIGMTEGERMRQRVVLEGIYLKQKEILQGGMDGVMIDLQRMYNTLAEICRVSYLDEPETYFIPPTSPQSQQAQQIKAQQAQDQAQQAQQAQVVQLEAQASIARAELQKAQAQQAKVQLQAQLDFLKQEFERIKEIADSQDVSKQLQFQYDKLYSDAALKLTEIEAKMNQELSSEYQQNVGTVQ